MPLNIHYCPNCGHAVEPHYKFCVDCGTDLVSVATGLSQRQSRSSPPSRSSATPSVDHRAGLSVTEAEAYDAAAQPETAPAAKSISDYQFVKRTTQFLDQLQGWPPDIQPPQFLSAQRSITIRSQRFSFNLALIVEILIILAITGVAGWMRTAGLTELSPGINIDESTYAAEIHRIVNGDWIGKFSGASLGVPTLQFYVTAPLFMLFDSELWAIRIVSAVAGTFVVPVAYVFIRRFLPFTASLVTVVLVAFSIYFMLESRIGWPLMLAIFELLVGLTLLVISVDRKLPWLAIVAGIVLGAGMYTHQVFLPYWASCIGLAIAIALFHPKLRHRRELYLFAVACFVTGINMAWFLVFEFDFVADLENHYGTSASIDFVRWARRTWDVFWYFRSPISADFTDAAPAAPILTGVLQLLFIFGLIITAIRIRDYRYQILVIGFLVGMAPAVLVPGSEARRFLVGMIFMFAFTGIGLSSVLQLAGSQLGNLLNTANTKVIAVTRNVVFALVISVFVVAAAIAGYNRLEDWRTKDARWTFNYDLVSLTETIKGFDESYTVHLYSDRSGVPHPIIDWVAPHLNVINGEEDRVDGKRLLDIGDTETGNVAIALLESYMDHAPDLREQYPNARFIESRDERDRSMWIVLVTQAP